MPRDALPGTAPAVLDLPSGERLAVMISWEVFFGGRARDGVSHGGTVLLNPTNGSSYTGTVLQTQQVASSRLRALEQGRWEVQVAPTGFSAFVTDEADVLDRTGISEQAVRVREVPLREGRTIYSRLGEIPFVLAALAVVVLGLLLARRDDRRAAAAGRPGRGGQSTSRRSVTGPSLTSSTCMSVRKRPVATDAPRARSSSATASTSGSASSGPAALIHEGRRPPEVSP